METLVEKGDIDLEHQVKSINDQILILNNSVFLLERELEKVSSEKEDPTYMHILVMLHGHYQELKGEFIHLRKDCMDLKNKFPDLLDSSINTEYKIKQRLYGIHQIFNSLLYYPQR